LPALHSSRRLTAGHYWHIIGLVLIVATLALSVNFGARAIPLGSTSEPGSVALGITVYTVTASLSALTLALLYFDLRARRDQPASARREYQHQRDLD
jgi:hypothetical protein